MEFAGFEFFLMKIKTSVKGKQKPFDAGFEHNNKAAVFEITVNNCVPVTIHLQLDNTS